MKWQELAARFLVGVALLGLPIGIVTARDTLMKTDGVSRTIEITASRPEDGGWSPEHITVNKGDRVRLRLHSSDALHGFALSGYRLDAGRLTPGKVTEIEFVADQAGRFTYYCNVWCSPHHPRMRGVLEVVDGEGVPQKTSTPAAAHSSSMGGHGQERPTAEFYPVRKPSAARGADLTRQLVPLLGLDVRRTSPGQAFQALKEGDGGRRSDEELWDLVAFLWSQHATAGRLEAGRRLYEKNCAACHGQTGRGDGPGGRSLKKQPADFTDARIAAGATGERYAGVIRGGGGGSGMPYWGTIFDGDETNALVDYLWTFMFELGDNM